MVEIHQPTIKKIRQLVYILLTSFCWMMFGLALGFGAMLTSGILMYNTMEPSVNGMILFSVFGGIIIVMAILIRLQQRHQGATVGNYWRLLISLVLCMGVGAFVFMMVDGLIVIIPYY